MNETFQYEAKRSHFFRSLSQSAITSSSQDMRNLNANCAVVRFHLNVT